MPYRTWGNAPGLEHKRGQAGYCPHNNLLFLGWHRPYLALYEVHITWQVFASSANTSQEVLYKHIQHIAAEAPPAQRANYTAAAKAFRLPYWDWARGEASGPVPAFFYSQNITVTRPGGSEDSIWNPLNSYRFHPLIPNDCDGKVRSHHILESTADNAIVERHRSNDSLACNRFRERAISSGPIHRRIRGPETSTT